MSTIGIKDLHEATTLDEAALSKFHGGRRHQNPTAQIDDNPTAQIDDFVANTGPDPLYFSKPIPHKE